jgi:hypothetical protein
MGNKAVASRGAAVLLLLVVAAGCVSVPSQTPTMKRVGVETVTATQLREIVLQFATGFGHAAETLGDSIRRANPNPDIQYRALMWQAMAIRNVREAALVSDPLLAMLDVWLFTVQLRSFVESPPPRYDILPGEHRAVAIELLRDQERKARAMAVRVAGEARVAAFEPRLLRFAADHPVDASTLNRTSVMAADTAMLREMGGGIGGAIGATYWSMRDLADRVTAINDAVGKELRWNLELMAYELASMPVVDSTLTSVRTSLDRIGALADTLPVLVSGERAVVLEALHAELATLTRSIDAMRLETLDAITQERVATLAAMDSIVARAIDQSESLVDHIFWRMIQLVAAVLVLLLVALAIIMRKRRPAEP